MVEPAYPGAPSTLDRPRILEVRPLNSRADMGIVKMKTTTLNQRGEAVQVSIGNVFVPRR